MVLADRPAARWRSTHSSSRTCRPASPGPRTRRAGRPTARVTSCTASSSRGAADSSSWVQTGGRFKRRHPAERPNCHDAVERKSAMRRTSATPSSHEPARPPCRRPCFVSKPVRPDLDQKVGGSNPSGRALQIRCTAAVSAVSGDLGTRSHPINRPIEFGRGPLTHCDSVGVSIVVRTVALMRDARGGGSLRQRRPGVFGGAGRGGPGPGQRPFALPFADRAR